jgi:hypothetical protein
MVLGTTRVLTPSNHVPTPWNPVLGQKNARPNKANRPSSKDRPKELLQDSSQMRTSNAENHQLGQKIDAAKLAPKKYVTNLATSRILPRLLLEYAVGLIVHGIFSCPQSNAFWSPAAQAF